MTRNRSVSVQLATAVDTARRTAREFHATGTPEDGTAAAEAALLLADAAEAMLATPAAVIRGLLTRFTGTQPRHRTHASLPPSADIGGAPSQYRDARTEVALAAVVVAAWIGRFVGPTPAPSAAPEQITVPTVQDVLRVLTSTDPDDRLERTHLIGDLIADLGLLATARGDDIHPLIAHALRHHLAETDAL